MAYQYPLLQKVYNHFKTRKCDLSEIELICCQHLLEPQLKMFEMFLLYGFKIDKITVLGKIYSTNMGILNEFEKKGLQATQPPFSGKSFDEEHTENCKKVVESCSNRTKIIVLDDGADLIEAFFASNKKVLFGVEQTSSGFRKLEKAVLHFPIINVARSRTKLNDESPLIARLFFERVECYLKDKLTKINVLVVGLGPIGESILQIFQQKNISCLGFDIKNGDTDLPSFIANTQVNVVIGATGRQVLTKEDIERFVSNSPKYFISVSSSDREFPVAAFRTGKEIHEDVTYKNITFVNNGFPFTFRGERNVLSPFEIEKTICLLWGAVVWGVVRNIKKGGLIDSPQELEGLIN